MQLGKTKITSKIDKRKKQRREGAEERAEQRSSRTDLQQLARLDIHGHRALRERARLAKRIEASSK